MITCVTLSRRPSPRADLPAGVAYLNHVSVFGDAAGLHAARLDALAKVATPGFVFVDDDDPFPAGVRLPRSAALLVGDEWRGPLRVDKSACGRADWLGHALGVHKAVGRTSVMQALLPQLPRGDFYTEWMLYAAMVELGGWEYSPAFVYRWVVRPGAGMHTRVRHTEAPTRAWIAGELPALVRRLSTGPPA